MAIREAYYKANLSFHLLEVKLRVQNYFSNHWWLKHPGNNNLYGATADICFPDSCVAEMALEASNQMHRDHQHKD